MAGTDLSAVPLQSLAAFTSLLHATAIAPIPVINASRPRPLAAAAAGHALSLLIRVNRLRSLATLACLLYSVSVAFSLPTPTFEVMHGGVARSMELLPANID